MNLIKKQAIGLLERATSKYGTITGIRHSAEADILEIDLHLPQADMEKWESAPYIKVKVGDMVYRDYSPTMWDSQTRTCSLIIDTSHYGPGSLWCQKVKAGNRITYLAIAPTNHKPILSGNTFCVGDISSIGHFLAMEQLALTKVCFSGFIMFNNQKQLHEFKCNYNTALTAVLASDLNETQRRINDYHLTNQTVYIAGNTSNMTQLRRYIKQQQSFEGIVKLKGFWS